jgi:hypothetical protein
MMSGFRGQKIKAVQRESEVRLVQMIDRMIAPWRPAVAEFEDIA